MLKGTFQIKYCLQEFELKRKVDSITDVEKNGKWIVSL